MKTGIFLVLYFGLFCTPGVLADSNHEIKRGDHPYMAFIYFLDPAIVDLTGSRFIRSAVLIRPEWLVTSALGPNVIDTPNGFPKQTLMARVGAISIDANITLFEEEFEQDREIVQVVRPFNNSATQWWTTDISLLKTLLPFNLTSTVAVKAIDTKRTFEEKTCIILFYSQYNNGTEKQLMHMFVEMLPSTSLNCGTYFSPGTMVCASDSDENKDNFVDPNFCQGSSGGPLICENEMMGLQTYIDNDCKQPHLYQLLSAWDNFITCSIESKCHEEQCANICDVTYKDPPTASTAAIEATGSKSSDEIVNGSISDGSESDHSPDSEFLGVPTLTPEAIIASEDVTTEEITKTSTYDSDITEPDTTTTESTTTTSTTTTSTTTTTTESTTEEDTVKVWPRENPTQLKSTDVQPHNPDIQRQEKVVTQLQKKKKRSKGSSQRNTSGLVPVILGVMFLACLN